MNAKLRDALPTLHEQLPFHLEEISGADIYYNDGDSRVLQSFFKLVFPKAVAYIGDKTFWVSFGFLTESELNTLRKWMENC